MSAADEYIVFDLETQRSFDDVGGYHNTAQLGLSVAVVYDTRSDATTVFREHEAGALVTTLQQVPLVIGFNIRHFDFAVLQPYTTVDLQALPNKDLLQYIYQKLGFRVSLDNLAQATLNSPKSASGLQAIAWFRASEWEKLIDYCRQDVLITRDLFRFGCEHGYVNYFDKYRAVTRRVAVKW